MATPYTRRKDRLISTSQPAAWPDSERSMRRIDSGEIHAETMAAIWESVGWAMYKAAGRHPTWDDIANDPTFFIPR